MVLCEYFLLFVGIILLFVVNVLYGWYDNEYCDVNMIWWRVVLFM